MISCLLLQYDWPVCFLPESPTCIQTTSRSSTTLHPSTIQTRLCSTLLTAALESWTTTYQGSAIDSTRLQLHTSHAHLHLINYNIKTTYSTQLCMPPSCPRSPLSHQRVDMGPLDEASCDLSCGSLRLWAVLGHPVDSVEYETMGQPLFVVIFKKLL